MENQNNQNATGAASQPPKETQPAATPQSTSQGAPPPQSSYNPLGGQVNEKSYTNTTSQNFSPGQLQGDIPEPMYMPPPPEENELPKKEIPKNGGSSQPKTPPRQEPFNPALNSLSDNDKNKAAEQAATYLMGLYKGAHVFGNEMLKISEKKVNKLVMAGEIDLSVAVPYDYNNNISLGEMIKEYNTQCVDVLTVEPEWEAAVMPPLTRILAKRGHGMTDEQFVLFMVSQDVAVKGYKFAQMKGQVNQILNFAREQSAAKASFVTAAPPPSAAPQQQAAPVQAQQQAAPVQQEAPVVHMQQEATTLQDKALQNVHNKTYVTEGEGAIMPAFGNQDKLSTMDKIHDQELREKSKRDRVRKKLHGHGVAVPVGRKKANVPSAGAKKRGRPAGSRNKKGGSGAVPGAGN